MYPRTYNKTFWQTPQKLNRIKILIIELKLDLNRPQSFHGSIDSFMNIWGCLVQSPVDQDCLPLRWKWLSILWSFISLSQWGLKLEKPGIKKTHLLMPNVPLLNFIFAISLVLYKTLYLNLKIRTEKSPSKLWIPPLSTLRNAKERQNLLIPFNDLEIHICSNASNGI